MNDVIIMVLFSFNLSNHIIYKLLVSPYFSTTLFDFSLFIYMDLLYLCTDVTFLIHAMTQMQGGKINPISFLFFFSRGKLSVDLLVHSLLFTETDHWHCYLHFLSWLQNFLCCKNEKLCIDFSSSWGKSVR